MRRATLSWRDEFLHADDGTGDIPASSPVPAEHRNSPNQFCARDPIPEDDRKFGECDRRDRGRPSLDGQHYARARVDPCRGLRIRVDHDRTLCCGQARAAGHALPVPGLLVPWPSLLQ